MSEDLIIGKRDGLSLTESFVGVWNNFFSEEECDRTIKEFNEFQKMGVGIGRQQQVNNPSKLEQDDHSMDTFDLMTLDVGRNFSHGPSFLDRFFNTAWPEYSKKYAELAKHVVAIRHLKFQKTEIGQGYHIWHTENAGSPFDRRCAVFTLFLNTVEEGGETEFLYYPGRVKAEQGKLIIWPAGYTHVHRGNPPISNTKYILTSWVEFHTA